MRLTIITILTLALLLIATPAFAETPIPDITGDNTVTQLSTFYGGASGQEGWCSITTDITNGDAGFVLGWLSNDAIQPNTAYFWGRLRGDFYDGVPSQADDYLIGLEAILGDSHNTYEFYMATEKIVFATEPKINMSYTGLGLRWYGSESTTLDIGAWYDLTHNYRISVSSDTVLLGDELSLSATAWFMWDDSDQWAWWRTTLAHPLDDTLDLAIVYEDSTRSNSTFLIGLQYTL